MMPVHPLAKLRSPGPRAAGRVQRGAAVLMALFIATLATLIVAGLFWTQFVLLRTIENQELAVQSRLLMRGALDWARAILREDQRTSAHDSLTEPWAQGLAETRLDQLGETSALAARASIAGGIEDAQARFNLRNLVLPDGQPNPREQESLRRLAALLGVPEAAADLISVRMQEALRPAPAEPVSGEDLPPRMIPLFLPVDLVGIAGIDRDAAAKLAPYVVVLDAPTAVNVNTAPPEVIAARIPEMTLSDARALIAQRERLGHFIDLADVRKYVRSGQPFGDQDLSTGSRYFFVRGQIKLDRAVTRMEALVQRGPGWQQPVRVLWQREL
jgi:general secretion pathway protein K